MTVIQTRITVAPDGSVSLAIPLPVGEHNASVELLDDKAISEIWDRLGFPTFDTGPIPEGTTFGREEIYGDGDDGR